MYALRRLVQGDYDMPKGPLGNNVRALQPLHHRTVRTNIDFTNSKVIQRHLSSLFAMMVMVAVVVIAVVVVVLSESGNISMVPASWNGRDEYV